ncbi:divalent-cation tolerance protein CutA [Pseudoalteromonas sp. OOF1S-7]|uniref:divalent-cation tolerance protein CutA n=1 Tax=Pseudoalteromonas sp. OOF1S-7 TaxID=2917757 RepID=UPI001EF58A82|nr:divalent-cation tolerance protein CutA [Pseudoalteromonas sp. OOF1S-7]MCG7536929.1 divalent-cation tolerance protein CutA [Pseudoalteromonas sp. OOF1S-7]
MTTPYRLVMTTCGTQVQARDIARHLVANKQAACVNILPSVESIYVWQGEITQDSEYKLMIKTHVNLLEAVMETIHRLHPYDVPEIQVIEICAGSRDYFNWIDEVLN